MKGIKRGTLSAFATAAAAATTANRTTLAEEAIEKHHQQQQQQTPNYFARAKTKITKLNATSSSKATTSNKTINENKNRSKRVAILKIITTAIIAITIKS